MRPLTQRKPDRYRDFGKLEWIGFSYWGNVGSRSGIDYYRSKEGKKFLLHNFESRVSHLAITFFESTMDELTRLLIGTNGGPV